MKDFDTPLDTDNTSELVNGLKAGNPYSFEQIYHLYSKKVYGVARSFYLDHDDAEEMIQEVFFKIWVNRTNINPSLSLQAYLITITKNTVLNFLRSRSVRQNYLLELANEQPLLRSNTDKLLELQELRCKLNALLGQLSPQRSKVFDMIRFEGMRIDEVAEELKLSKRTVEHHLYHATKFIKSRLSLELLVLLSFSGFF